MTERKQSRVNEIAGDVLVVVVSAALVAIVGALAWRAVWWILP